jgi:hypothetical protein
MLLGFEIILHKFKEWAQERGEEKLSVDVGTF